MIMQRKKTPCLKRRDIASCRRDFPSLDKKVYGRRYAFLDSAASSLKPTCVVKAMAEFLTGDYANIHRGLYHDSLAATERFEGARAALSRFFGLDAETETLVFTKNATEAVNLVADALVRPRLSAGDVILLTVMEHHANIVPWQKAARAAGARIAYVPITADGTIDPDVFEAACRAERPKIAAFTWVSNALGTINPVVDMTRAARAVGAEVLVDAAQAAAHGPLDFHAVGADYMAVSAHKMLGPTGGGALLTRRKILDDGEPYQVGGDMIIQVLRDRAVWNAPPWKYEAGTPPIAEAVGWAAACAYIERIGWAQIRAHEKSLLARAISILDEYGIPYYGPKSTALRSGVISFNVPDIHPHDVGTVFDREGMAVRAGHHCAQVLMDHLGITASVRLSVSVYNTLRDIEQLRRGLSRVREVFQS